MTTFVTTDGVELFYDTQGHGRRVYALSGGPANDHRYIAEDLAPMRDDYEIVAPDYRGGGQSERAPADTYRIARLAADLDELRATRGDDKIIVLGHSMGGLVAQSYAIQFPERCDRLILVGTFPCTVPSKMLPPLLRALGVARTMKMAGRGVWWLLAWSWRPRSEERSQRLYAIWSTWQEGLAPVRAREVERERRLGLPLENDNIQALQREFRSLDLIDQLPAITCPVLVLYGDRDAGAVGAAAVFAEHIRDVTTTPLADIGHDPFFEAPGPATAAVRDFLR